jgi:hypothetical protein
MQKGLVESRREKKRERESGKVGQYPPTAVAKAYPTSQAR